jgi:hypothetical protein
MSKVPCSHVEHGTLPWWDLDLQQKALTGNGYFSFPWPPYLRVNRPMATPFVAGPYFVRDSNLEFGATADFGVEITRGIQRIEAVSEALSGEEQPGKRPNIGDIGENRVRLRQRRDRVIKNMRWQKGQSGAITWKWTFDCNVKYHWQQSSARPSQHNLKRDWLKRRKTSENTEYRSHSSRL